MVEAPITSIDTIEKLKPAIEIMKKGLKDGNNNEDVLRQTFLACYALVRNVAFAYGANVGEINNTFFEVAKSAKTSGNKKIRVR